MRGRGRFRRGPGRRRGIPRRLMRRRSLLRARRQARVIPFGLFTLLNFVGTGAALKLHRDEIEQIEREGGKPVGELSEEQLRQVMDRLDISENTLSEEESRAAQAVERNETTMEDLELLEKMTQMLYSGFLTEEEYEVKKRQILGLEDRNESNVK